MVHIFYLLGNIFEIVAWFFQSIYWAKMPWSDQDVSGFRWTEEGQSYGEYRRPHGGMYSDFWWGSRLLIAAIFAILSTILMATSWFTRNVSLIAVEKTTRSLYNKINLGVGFGAILSMVASVVAYMQCWHVAVKFRFDNTKSV